MKKLINVIKDNINKWNPKDKDTILLEQAIREWEKRNNVRDRKGNDGST